MKSSLAVLAAVESLKEQACTEHAQSDTQEEPAHSFAAQSDRESRGIPGADLEPTAVR